MSPTVPLKDYWKEQKIFLSRLIVASFMILILTSVLVWRLFQLQVVEHDFFSELSQGNQLRIEPLAPTRGLIYDRNGVVLAENLPAWELTVIPEQVLDLEAQLQDLGAIGLIPLEYEGLTELVRSHRGFERVKLANLSDVQAARFAVRRHQFPGVDIQEGLIRNYPFGELTSHAVGYVASISRSDLDRINRSEYAATSLIGKSGIERSYEVTLHGSVGYRQQLVNAQGRILMDPVLAANSRVNLEASQVSLETRWPLPGENVFLGLDIELQIAAHKALEGKRGAVVAIEPDSGDILALVSMPTFDPNQFAGGLSQTDFQILNDDPDKPLFHRALAGHYPPGSTIKPFLGLAALHHRVLDPDHREMCPGYFLLPGHSHRYRDWKPEGHGPMDLHQSIVQSCDTYFYQLAVNLGIDNMSPFLEGFGFGERTGIDILNENAGVIPSREWKRTQFAGSENQTWYPGETVITGIGQGFTLVTPLQLAHATAVLATGGQRFKPRLVIGTEDPLSGTVSKSQPVLLDVMSNIEESHWIRIVNAMVGVNEERQGSGRNAMRGAEYTVAGKTGTAQVFSLAADEEYIEEEVDEYLRDHGLFIAYAPVDHPVIALAVVVENGGGGGVSAAPIAREILDAYFIEDIHVSEQH